MKMNKDFDCVEMKNRIQAELRKRWAGMTDEEIEFQIREDLRKSQSPIAKLWRRIEKKDVSSGLTHTVTH